MPNGTIRDLIWSPRLYLVLVASAATLLAAAPAGAATLAVDDDGTQCPNATFTSVQAAIDAAAPGDAVAVCAGTYVEGSGMPGSNALTIDESIDLRGAGADLVQIRANPGAGGQIAAASPALRDPTGNLLTIAGVPGSPLTVNVSGLTFDGNAVYSEAGIVFLDAMGSVVRSRVTRVVTSEAADANAIPGGYRSNELGYGIAHVSAAVAPPGGDPRTLLIDHTRIDKYNKVGVLIDGATGDTPPLVASGVDNRGELVANQIVGHTQCINFEEDGDCSSPGNPTTGPLFGQDGVRVTAGARASVIDNTISQNLVAGTGAPDPGTPSGNSNLRLGAGVRLLGAASTSVTHTNVVDNAYGVINLGLDGTSTNTAVPVAAENNWWGLDPLSTANTGPDISPSTNPPTPENPVNGNPFPDGAGSTSNAVDFFPFRDGPQSDPNSGELPVVDAPIPVNDTPPAVVLETDAPEYDAGQTATLTANATDDFDVARVDFYDGSQLLASDTSPPFVTQLPFAVDAECVTHPLTAIALDSVGQSGGGSAEIEVTGPPGHCVPDPPPSDISVELEEPPAIIGEEGTTFSADATADAGIAKVDFILGDTPLCSDATAPYECDYLPRGDDVGNQFLLAVATDLIDQTAQDTAGVTVDRFQPDFIGIRLKRQRQRSKTLRGRVQRPERVDPEDACIGTVTITLRVQGIALTPAQTELRDNCTYRLRIRRSAVGERGRFIAFARFGGNTVLKPVESQRKFK